jgi:hypothetical protein
MALGKTDLVKGDMEKTRKSTQLIAGIALVLSVMACGVAPIASAPTADVSTIVAATLQALTGPTSVPAATQPAPPTTATGVPVSFGAVSFVIPNGLASGAACETVPAVNDQSGAPWDVAPAYTRCTLQAYPLQGKFWQPQLMVYPAQDYASASESAAASIQKLQAILASPSPALTNDALPNLPFANAGAVFAAQPLVLTFQDGKGVRVLTEYAQYVAPANNHDLFYHFEGLTTDGKAYIVITLPVNAPFLAAESDPSASIPADGIPFPGTNVTDSAQYDAYYQTVVNRLSMTPPETFQPSLTALDALIRSLEVTQ